MKYAMWRRGPDEIAQYNDPRTGELWVIPVWDEKPVGRLRRLLRRFRTRQLTRREFETWLARKGSSDLPN